MTVLTATGAALTGLFLGWALQQGGFCMNTAFRSILFREDRSILRAWILVLVINIPAVLLLEDLGILYPARAPFRPVSAAVGGLLFGAGMVWAGGCVSGTYYRTAKGSLGSLLALIGFGGGAAFASAGALFPLVRILDRTEWSIRGDIPHLGHFYPSDPWIGRWIAGALLVIAGVIFLVRSPRSRFTVGWKWPLTGTVIGGIALASWLLSSFSGRDYGLSLVQPTLAWTRWFTADDTGGFNWTVPMLAALPAGAFLAAWKSGDLRLRMPPPRRALNQLLGGLVMGIGAVIAGGCNIGHGITGISTLAVSSVVATAATMLGNWGATVTVWRMARRKVEEFPVRAGIKE